MVEPYYPDLRIQEILSRDYWDRLRRLFVKERNVTFDRYEAFPREQGKTKNLEQYHCLLTELVVKGNFKCLSCNDGRLETEIIRDLFTANMSNDEVQKDLLAETKTPEYAIRREKSVENQLVIRKQGSPTSTQVSKMKTEPVGFIQKRGQNNNHYPTRGKRTISATTIKGELRRTTNRPKNTML